MTLAAGLEHLLPTYARADLVLVRGDGPRVWDSDGREYLDFGGGIAVVSLGHCHPAPLAAAQVQLEKLWHVSNLYRTEPSEELAAKLSARFGGARAFFCNSGAEAVEAAIKYARKATGRPGVLALEGGFHGRTLGALSATGQAGKRDAFEPLVPGVRFLPPNDVDALRATYEKVFSLEFGAEDPDLGHARAAKQPDGSLLGIRKPLAEHESPIMRTSSGVFIPLSATATTSFGISFTSRAVSPVSTVKVSPAPGPSIVTRRDAVPVPPLNA